MRLFGRYGMFFRAILIGSSDQHDQRRPVRARARSPFAVRVVLPLRTVWTYCLQFCDTHTIRPPGPVTRRPAARLDPCQVTASPTCRVFQRLVFGGQGRANRSSRRSSGPDPPAYKPVAQCPQQRPRHWPGLVVAGSRGKGRPTAAPGWNLAGLHVTCQPRKRYPLATREPEPRETAPYCVHIEPAVILQFPFNYGSCWGAEFLSENPL